MDLNGSKCLDHAPAMLAKKERLNEETFCAGVAATVVAIAEAVARRRASMQLAACAVHFGSSSLVNVRIDVEHGC